MNSTTLLDLSDCTECRQLLMARPPRFIRATMLLLVALGAIAILWAAQTEADLVVRARGRVRPMVESGRFPDAAEEESRVSPLKAGRVVELHVQEGDSVRQGDLLIRLGAEQLDNDIIKQQSLIATGQQELKRLDQKEQILKQRYQAARAKAQAELFQAQEGIRISKQQRASAIGLAEVELQLAEDELQRLQKLVERAAATQSELVRAESRAREAVLKLQQAKLAVDESQLLVLRQACDLLEKDHTVECSELETQRELKRSEVEFARLELASLEWEREQSILCAPSDGTVTSLEVRVGDVVEAGQPVLVIAMADQRGFRIDVTVTSDEVGLLREGLAVRVKLDSYDYQKYGSVTGRVAYIAPDSELPSESTAGGPATYTVRIILDDVYVGRGVDRGRIKLGMTGMAEIITDREMILSLLVRSIRQSVSLG